MCLKQINKALLLLTFVLSLRCTAPEHKSPYTAQELVLIEANRSIVDSVARYYGTKFADSTVEYLIVKAAVVVKKDTTDFRKVDFVFEKCSHIDFAYDVKRYREILEEDHGIRTMNLSTEEYLSLLGVPELESRLCARVKCFPERGGEFELFRCIVGWMEQKSGYKRVRPRFKDVFWKMRAEEFEEFIKETKKSFAGMEKSQLDANPEYDCRQKNLPHIRSINPDLDPCDGFLFSRYCCLEDGEPNYLPLGLLPGYRHAIYQALSEHLYCKRDTTGLLPLTFYFDSAGVLTAARPSTKRYDPEMTEWFKALSGKHKVRLLNKKPLGFVFVLDQWLDHSFRGAVIEKK